VVSWAAASAGVRRRDGAPVPNWMEARRVAAGGRRGSA
jgi:hypothetical protein